MAAVAAHHAKAFRAAEHAGLDKENFSPTRTKIPQKHRKTHDISGIFDYPRRMDEKRGIFDRRHIALSPKFAGIGKPGYFARLHEEARARESAKKSSSRPDVNTLLGHAQRQNQKENQQAMSFGFAALIKPYVEETTASWSTEIKKQRKQLEGVRQGIDYETGKPLAKLGLVSKEDFAALAKRIEDLDQPFPDDRVTLQFRNSDGDISTKIVRVADIKDNILKRRKAQEAKHKQLEQDLAAIEEEITERRQELVVAGKKATKDIEKQMKVFEKEKKEIEALAKAERADMRQEQKRATDTLNQKIQELYALVKGDGENNQM